MVESPGQLATTPRICPLLSTFARLTLPDGAVARQSVKVPPVSIQSCQMSEPPSELGNPLTCASLAKDLHQHSLVSVSVEVAVEDLVMGIGGVFTSTVV